MTNTEIGQAYLSYCRRRLTHEYLLKVKSCLEELNEEDVWWRAHETDNSIGNLLLHLCGNVRQWIISGIGGREDVRDRPAEFAARGSMKKPELLRKFEDTVHEAGETLDRFDAGRLLEVRHIQQYDVTCLDAISHVIEHVSQHVGQIVYITKLRKGIDLNLFALTKFGDRFSDPGSRPGVSEP